MTWPSYSINTSRSAKSGLPNRVTRFDGVIHQSHPTPHHAHCVQSNIWKGKGGKRGPALVAVFFYAFRGLHTLARIYILTSSGASVQPFISFQCRLICLLFFYPLFFDLLESNVNIDWSHTLPIHCSSLLFTYTPCDPLCTHTIVY